MADGCPRTGMGQMAGRSPQTGVGQMLVDAWGEVLAR